MSEEGVRVMEEVAVPRDKEAVSMASTDGAHSSDIKKLSVLEGEAKQTSMNLMEKTRRIAFTDAAVAISMTLLILPLMDAAVEARGDDISSTEWFGEQRDLLLTFFLSYMVICMAWMDHDKLFCRVGYFTRVLSILNILWLMTIAFIPVATNIMNAVADDDSLEHFIWIGSFLFAKLLTFFMTIIVHRNPETWSSHGGGPQFPGLVESIVSLTLLTMALFVSATNAGYWIMFTMVLRVPITKRILWKFPNLKTKWQVTTSSDVEPEKDDEESRDTPEKNVNEDVDAPLYSYLLSLRDRSEGLMEAERQIVFIDAAAAIALTLLVLPLMNAGTEARGEGLSTAEWFQQNASLFIYFVISYLVIILGWIDQDSLFREVAAFTRLLSILDFLVSQKGVDVLTFS